MEYDCGFVKESNWFNRDYFHSILTMIVIETVEKDQAEVN